MKVTIKLRELRESKRLTQEQVSRKIDVVNATYRNIETGRVKNFRIDTLFKLKKVLELDNVEDLFDVDYENDDQIFLKLITVKVLTVIFFQDII